MRIFKSYTYTWWQIGVFKLALLSIGVLIGSYWSGFWGQIPELLIVVALVTTAYTMYASLKQ